MNTNSNTYTVIYSIGLVVVVAAVLAFVAKFLQPMQDENVKKDTISQILTAADIKYAKDANVLDIYRENLDSAFVVNLAGAWVEGLSTQECTVYGTSDLKEQMDKQEKFPVYKFKNGVTVIPCYGAGLWGPVWGYIGLESDLNTIRKVCFGHKGETPGLGAKITDEPKAFADNFAKKQLCRPTEEYKRDTTFVKDTILVNNEIIVKDTISIKIDTTVTMPEFYFEVAKANSRTKGTENNGVDAISGATITTQAVGAALNNWFGFYQGYLNQNKTK